MIKDLTERQIETAMLLGEAHAIVAFLVEDIESGETVAPHRLDLARRWLTKMHERAESDRRRHPDLFDDQAVTGITKRQTSQLAKAGK